MVSGPNQVAYLVLSCCGGRAHMADYHSAAMAPWLWRKNVQVHRASTLPGWQERLFFHSPGIILAWAWEGPGTSSKPPINFIGICKLWMGLYPLARLTGLFGLAPPNNPAPQVGEGGLLIPLIEQNCNSLECEKLCFLDI